MLLIEPKFISICFAINLADTVAYRLRKIVSDIESVSYSEQNIFNLSHQEILEKDYGMIIIDARGSTRDSLHFCLNVRENAELDNILIAVIDDSSIESEEIRFLSAGADCYISTTMTDKIIKCRFNSLLRRYKHFIISRSLSLELEDEIKSKMKALQNFQNLSVIALTQLAGARDNETGKHIIRTQLYVKRLAEEASQGTYALQLNKDYIEYMFQAAPLHDIGKVGIPDAILKKPGRLTYEEMEIMKKHTVIGRDALAEAEARTGFRSAIFEVAKEIAYSHQEKWDGSGYPEGLAGDRIPLSARIMAISDVYDALISKRVYKGELTHEEAVEIINAGSGKHFDPVLIDAFNRCAHKFRDIANEYKEQ